MLSYLYNGLGDRLQQTVNGQTISYTLDLNAGLTQVLQDGIYSYLYGNGRIAQESAAPEYFLGDALGSVRQMAGQTGEIVYAASYSPYGEVIAEEDTSQTSYGYTGETTDSSGMVYLRSRYYRAADGRFLNRDTWLGEANDPGSFHRWAYVQGNPINRTDPSGMSPEIPSYHLKYCSGLRGRDLRYCYSIVLGINPEVEVSISELRYLDICISALHPGCNCNPVISRRSPFAQIPLEDSLPTNVGNITTPIQNGWWFHMLLDKAKGAWNNFGRDHVYFRDVIGYAMSVEMAKYQDPRFQELIIDAFANKGSSEGMYFMVGGRQSVITRVATAVGGPDFHICGPRAKDKPNGVDCEPIDSVLSSFTRGLIWRFDPSWGQSVMSDYNGQFIRPNYYDAAWDFANVTDFTIATYSGVIDAFKKPAGSDNTSLLFHTPAPNVSPNEDPWPWYYSAYVLSYSQQRELCGGASCVK